MKVYEQSNGKEMKIYTVITLIMGAFLLEQGNSAAKDRSSSNPQKERIVFVYVHGFGEFKEVVPFEAKMRKFLQRLPLKSRVFTYRWDWMRVDLTKVVHLWTQAKIKADLRAKDFMDEVVMKLEAEGTPYVIVAYSTGARVLAKSLNHGKSTLKSLRGIYFLGAALPHTFRLNRTILPEGMQIVNYYSPYFDDILKIPFYNAEGVKAGGEVGFDDTDGFQNYRTVCTHLHKGGPIQRDYSDLAPAIAYLSLFKEGIFLEGEPANFNLEMPVAAGSLHWNDLLRVETPEHDILIQQNVNTNHYRAVAIDGEEKRSRKAWGRNLHSVLKKVGLFPASKQKIKQLFTESSK